MIEPEAQAHRGVQSQKSQNFQKKPTRIETPTNFLFKTASVVLCGLKADYGNWVYLYGQFLDLESFNAPTSHGTRKNSPRKSVLQKMFFVKRMLGNFNDFYFYRLIPLHTQKHV